jgi:hypothetical protein
VAYFPPVSIRQPQPHDIVGHPIEVCGLGTGFEGTLQVRVRALNAAVLLEEHFMAGGMGIWGNFHLALELPDVPPTTRGTIEVFEYSAEDGSEIHKVVVPVVFGRALLDPYAGFLQHEVVPGDTLSGLAQAYYGSAAQFGRIFEANRDRLHDPNLIFVGQVLRVPQ